MTLRRLDKKTRPQAANDSRKPRRKAAKKGAPSSAGPTDREQRLRTIPRHATLVRKHVLCGKCPKKHGPYWFAAWKEGRRTRWRYIGSDAAAAEVLAWRGEVARAEASTARNARAVGNAPPAVARVARPYQRHRSTRSRRP